MQVENKGDLDYGFGTMLLSIDQTFDQVRIILYMPPSKRMAPANKKYKMEVILSINIDLELIYSCIKFLQVF